MARVYSRRKGAEPVPPDAVYVGRPTQFGNPFVVGRDGARGECIELYREWIMQPECAVLRDRARRDLAGKDLCLLVCPSPLPR